MDFSMVKTMMALKWLESSQNAYIPLVENLSFSVDD